MAEDRFTTCNLCEAMCGLVVGVEANRVISVRGDPDDVLSHGHICPKAVGLRDLLDDPDRIRTPLIREGPGFRAASWEEAMERAAAPLRRIQKKHGPDAIALYVGNPAVHNHRSSLAAQLLTMTVATHNRFDPNSQDSNPRLFACMQVYGDALTTPIPDVDRTQFLLLLGTNPAASNGSHMALGDARKRLSAIRERGGRIVLIDPRRTETAAWASEHHFIRPGGDAALLSAMLHTIFEDEGAGRTVPRRNPDLPLQGEAELRRVIADFSPERVASAVGIPADTIRALARAFAASESAAALMRVGVCQSEFGPLAAWLVEALNVVTGNVGRAGGLCLPRPAVDIGPIGRRFVGNRWGQWKSRVRGLPEFLGVLPSAVMAEEMETPGLGQIRALVVFAGNPVLSTPNGERLARALPNLEHLVSIDYYRNETSRHAHVILPPRHVFETGNYDILLSRFAVRTIAKYNPPILATEDDTRDDWAIATDLALALRAPEWLPGWCRSLVRTLAKPVPDGLVDALLRVGRYRLSLGALRRAPHGLDLGPLEPDVRGAVRLPDGKVNVAPAVFLADMLRLAAWLETPPPPLSLIGRRHVRSNNSWMHNLRSLAKGTDRSQVHVHPDDAARCRVENGDQVTVASRVGSVSVRAVVTADMMPGVVSMPHGFGHQDAADGLHIAGALPGASANALTDDARVEPIIGTSILNGVPITLSGTTE